MQEGLEGGMEHTKLDMTLVELPNGDIQPVKAGVIINAAGAWAGQVSIISSAIHHSLCMSVNCTVSV